MVTGQQAGLFGGPLYTLLKAMTAIRLAARTSREHGTVVVPVFWIDAEDHDWNEIAACGVLDGNQAGARSGWRRPTAPATARSRALTYTDEIDTAIGELEQALPHTEFTRELPMRCARLHAGPQRARRVRPMARANLWAARPRGVRCVGSGRQAVRGFAVSSRDRACRAHDAPGGGSRASRLTDLGYHAQVTPGEASVALFDLDTVRRPIKVSGDHLTIGDDTVSRAALAERAAAQPHTFSPNVLLRPLVQDTSSRRSVTSRGRTSWRTTRSFARSMTASACRCR